MTTITPVDKKMGYDEETLSDCLASDESGRHVLRIAHLYFGRTPHLTAKDMKEEIPRLLSMIFGLWEPGHDTPLFDLGWMSKCQSTDGPASYFDLIRTDLLSTFDDKRVTRQNLIAFRLCHIFDPKDLASLYNVIFFRNRDNDANVLYLDSLMFPQYIRRFLKSQFEHTSMQGDMVRFPWNFYNSLAFSQHISLYRKGQFATTLEEYFIIRFLNWFVFSGHAAKDPETGATQKQSMSSSSSQATLQKQSQPAGVPELCYSVCNTRDLFRGNAGLEIFREHLESLLPHGHESRLSKQSWLFFFGVLHFWLLRNVDPLGQPRIEGPGGFNSGISRQLQMQGGATTYRFYSELDNSMSNFLEPSKTLMKGILIFFTYLQTHPGLRVNLSTGQQLGGVQLVDDLNIGISGYLTEMRKPMFDFLIVSMNSMFGRPRDTVNDVGLPVGLASVIDLWLAYIQPWRAVLAWNPRVASATGPKRSKEVGPLHSILGNRDEKSATGNVGKGSTAPSDKYDIGWMYYVVQHYICYAQILTVAVKALANLNITQSDFEVVCRMFAEQGPFSDPILVVLRVCEIIVEDEEMHNAPRSIWHQVCEAFPWIGERASAAPDSSEFPVEIIQDHVKQLERNRRVVYEIVKRQMVDMNGIVDSYESGRMIERLLHQMEGMVSDLQKKLRVTANHSYAGDWLGIGGPSRPGPGGDIRVLIDRGQIAIQRIRKIYRLPDLEPQGVGQTLTNSRNGLEPPEAAITFGSPNWFSDKVYCVYRRLTTLGRVELASGEKQCRNDKIAYIGDPLVNPPPVCSYEIGWLVRVTYVLSVWLNKLFGLDKVLYDVNRDPSEEGLERTFRINLRFMADARNLLFADFVFIILNAAFIGAPVTMLCLTLFSILVAFLTTSEVVFFVTSGGILTFFAGVAFLIQQLTSRSS